MICHEEKLTEDLFSRAIVDRLKRGYVVDYFSIRFKKLKKIVFNLGDICIFLGAGILLAAQIVESVREH